MENRMIPMKHWEFKETMHVSLQSPAPLPQGVEESACLPLDQGD
jgi:hypothetical protein